MNENKDLGEEMIVALRRVIRAVDLHSRTLVKTHGLTGPQALILKALHHGGLAAGELSNRVSLSQGTVTDILNRLEQRGLVKRIRDSRDRRRVLVENTDAGIDLVETTPPLLQESFIQRFSQLQDWEQNQLLSSLQRIASMMGAADIDAAPVLSSGSVLATATAIEDALEPESAQQQQSLSTISPAS